MKKIFIIAIVLTNLLFALPATVQATYPIKSGSETANNLENQNNAFLNATPFDKATTVGGIVAIAINVVLSLLGIIFVILLIYGGVLWMTAAGNEEQVRKAIGLIKTAVIGLIIIVSAYSITYFVFSSLNEATMESGSLG